MGGWFLLNIRIGWSQSICFMYVMLQLLQSIPLIINIDDSSCWGMSHAVSTLFIYAGYIIYDLTTTPLHGLATL